MINMRMEGSYPSSFIDLPVVLVDCWVEGLHLRFKHVCQEVCVLLYSIGSEGGERKFCINCNEKLGVRGNVR